MGLHYSRAQRLDTRVAVHRGVSLVAPVGPAAGGDDRVLPRTVCAGIGPAAASRRASADGFGLYGSAANDAARAARISGDELRWADAAGDARRAHDLRGDPRPLLSRRPRSLGQG